MELYNFYSLIYMIAGMFFTEELKVAVLSGAVGGFALWLALFFMQGAGLYAMAKRLRLRKKWLAFLPFANIYYMGKIVGECRFFSQRMKNTGLYVMISQIVTSLATVAYIGAESYLIWNFKPMVSEMGTLYWIGLTGFAGALGKVYDICSYLMSIFSLVTQILLTILMVGLYKKYSPSNFRLLAVLTFIFPMLRFIMIFAFRKREPFNYEAYMRRKQEEYIRRQQQYYNNYGNPYGGPNSYGGQNYGGQSPYGMGGYQGAQGGQYPQPPQVEEPFGEFSQEGPSSADGKGEKDGDGFFD